MEKEHREAERMQKEQSEPSSTKHSPGESSDNAIIPSEASSAEVSPELSPEPSPEPSPEARKDNLATSVAGIRAEDAPENTLSGASSGTSPGVLQDVSSEASLGSLQTSSAGTSSAASVASADGTPSAGTPSGVKGPKHSRPPKARPSTVLEPGPAEKTFGVFSFAGLPVLLFLTALMCVAELIHVRPLWFSDEVRHADVYMRLLGGDWLALSLNGLPYPDKPPLYFWFLKALDDLPGLAAVINPPMVFFLGTALSALFFVGSTWLLARGTGHDRRVAFTSGLLALGCLFVAGLAHYPRMDLLFSAIIVLSLLCLYRGWIKKSAPLWLTWGFVLAAVAALIKGPLALAFPLLSSILFLVLRGTPGRLNARDGLLGFALMLLIVGGWVMALYFQGYTDYLREIFGPQIAGRMVNAWHHAAPWWYYLAALPLLCLPWTFLLFAINWVQAGKQLPAAWKARREQGAALWLWVIFLSGFVLLSAVSGKIAIYLMPIMPALAVLAARALLRLTPGRSRYFFCSVGAIFVLLGLLFALAQGLPYLLPYLPGTWSSLVPPLVRAYMDNTSGLALMGLAALLSGVVLLRFTRRSLPGGSLLLAALGTLVIMQPYALVVAPSLDTMLSPRAQAESMAALIHKGYYPAAYRVYPGIYTYYVNVELGRLQGQEGTGWPGVSVPDLGDTSALDAVMAEQPRVVLAMREKDWNRWEDKAANMHVVQRQWIVDQPYVLVTRDAEPFVFTEPAPTPALTEMPGETGEIGETGETGETGEKGETGEIGNVESPDEAGEIAGQQEARAMDAGTEANTQAQNLGTNEALPEQPSPSDPSLSSLPDAAPSALPTPDAPTDRSPDTPPNTPTNASANAPANAPTNGSGSVQGSSPEAPFDKGSLPNNEEVFL